MSTKERNQTFNYLYVMAIIMVIDDHCSTRIGFLSSIFPYNSFYMPLFVFVSGYFFRRTALWESLKHKSRKLLLPYILWNMTAWLTAAVIDRCVGTSWAPPFSVKLIIKTFIYSSPTSLNGAAWFLIMLFWVSVGYNVIRLIVHQTKINDIVLTVLFAVLGFASVYLCTKGYYNNGIVMVFLLKISFYIQFYHYGYMFKLYAESLVKRFNRFAVCSLCVIINVLLILKFGNKISFVATSEMGSFYYWYLPLITSATGILFYYELMSFLSEKIGKTKITDVISRNTLIILETHLFFVNIPNIYCYLKHVADESLYADFPVERFLSGAWLRYSTNSRLAGFFFGLAGSLAVVFIWEKIKSLYNKKQSVKNT